MAIAQITAWLRSADKDYQLGVALYDKYGDKSHWKIFFLNGESDFHLVKLQEELEDLNGRIEAPASKPVLVVAAPVTIPDLSTIPVPAKLFSLTDEQWQKAPDLIKDLYTQTHRLKSRADYLYLQVRSCSSAVNRLALALAQLADRELINKNWKAIKEFQEIGAVAEKIEKDNETPIAELSIAELSKSHSNLQTYLSKARKNLKDMKPGTKRDKTVRRIQDYEVKLKLVKERLANA